MWQILSFGALWKQAHLCVGKAVERLEAECVLHGSLPVFVALAPASFTVFEHKSKSIALTHAVRSFGPQPQWKIVGSGTCVAWITHLLHQWRIVGQAGIQSEVHDEVA